MQHSFSSPYNVRDQYQHFGHGMQVKYGNHAYVTFTSDRDYIHITIEIDGPGTAEADQDRIFEPFVRLENPR